MNKRQAKKYEQRKLYGMSLGWDNKILRNEVLRIMPWKMVRALKKITKGNKA